MEKWILQELRLAQAFWGWFSHGRLRAAQEKLTKIKKSLFVNWHENSTSDSFAFTAALYFISSFSFVAFVFFSRFITSVKYTFFSCSSKGVISSFSFMILSSDVRVSIKSVWLWLRNTLLPVNTNLDDQVNCSRNRSAMRTGVKRLTNLTIHGSCKIRRAGSDLFTDLLFNNYIMSFIFLWSEGWWGWMANQQSPHHKRRNNINNW